MLYLIILLTPRKIPPNLIGVSAPVSTRRTHSDNSFELEALEPRLLLSADFACGAALTSAAAITPHQTSIVEQHHEIVSDTAISYDSAPGFSDIFGGTTGQELASPERASAVVNETPAGTPMDAPTPVQEAAASEQKATPAPVVQVVSPAPLFQSPAALDSGEVLGASPVTSSDTISSQLVETLTAANGPPAVASGVFLPAALQDLQDYIVSKLPAAGTSFTLLNDTTHSSASIDGVLDFTGLTLNFTATRAVATDPWGGTVTISSTSATLFPGKSFSATVTDNTGDSKGISGTFNILARTFSVTAEQFVLTVGEALTMTSMGFTLAYNRAGAANQTLVTAANVKVNSPVFDGIADVNLASLIIRKDGFSFAGAVTLTATSPPAPADPIALGDVLSLDQISITATNLNVTYGGAPSVTGSFAFTLTGLHLFPTGNFVQTSGSATGAISFAGFNGTAPSGTFSVAVTGFAMMLGESLRLTAPGTVTFQTGSTVMVTIPSLMVSSPQFGGVTGTVTGLDVRRDGFSLANATFGPFAVGTLPSVLSDVLQIGTVKLTLTDFVLNNGRTVMGNMEPVFGVTGVLGIELTSVVLFPGVSFLSTSLGTVGGLYQFNLTDPMNPSLPLPNPGQLKLNIPSLNFTLGEALTVQLGAFTLSPSQPLSPLAILPSVTISSPTLAGLQNYQITNFELSRTGFTLGSFSLLNLDPTAKIGLGDFLQFNSVTLLVGGITVNRTALPVVSGTVTATLTGLKLFPSSNAVVTTIGSVTASYDFSTGLSTGALTIGITDFSLTVGGSLAISIASVSIKPGQTTIATLTGATLTFPSLNNATGTLASLAIQKTGFTITSGSVSLSTLTLGSFFSLTNPTLTFTNVVFQNGASITGTFGLTTTSAALTLGSALTSTITDKALVDGGDADDFALTGTYDLTTKKFQFTLDQFDLTVATFVAVHADGADFYYDPATDGSVKMLMGATGVSIFLGSGSGMSATGVQVTNGKFGLALYKPTSGPSTYALSASGDVATVGFSGVLNLSGNVSVRKNTTGSAVDETLTVNAMTVPIFFNAIEGALTEFFGNNLMLSLPAAPGLPTVSGNLSFTRVDDMGVTKILVGAQGINLFLGTADESMGLRVVGANLGLVIYRNTMTNTSVYALDASATAQLVGFDGILSLSGTIGIRANTTGGAVTEDIAVGGTTVPVHFLVTDPAGPNFSGKHITLSIAGFVSLSGDFSFERNATTSGTTTKTEISIGATNIDAFLGANEGQPGETGLRVTGASLGLLFFKTVNTALMTQAPATYALVASGGTNQLVGVPGLTLGSNGLLVKVNKTGTDVTDGMGMPRVISTPGGNVTLDFTATGSQNVTSVEGHITLIITGFVSLEGDFSFTRTEDLGSQTTKLLVGASGVNAFLGVNEEMPGETGVRITGASLGLVIYKKPVDPMNPMAPTSTYALDASASAELVGFGDVTLSAGMIGVRVNTTGGAVDETVTVLGTMVPIQFSASEGNVKAFSGADVTLSISGFVSLRGSFSFQKSTTGNVTEIQVAATGVDVFLGANMGQPDETGVRINDASLGLILFKNTMTNAASTYALSATGGVELVGVTNVTLTGFLAVKINNTGTNVTDNMGAPRVLTTPTGSVTLDFLTTGMTNVKSLSGSVVFGLTGFTTLTANFSFQKTETVMSPTVTKTQIDVSATMVNVFLGANEGAANETGLRITGAGFALRMFKTVDTTLMTQAPSTYALVAGGGTVQLVGVPDLVLTASLTVMVNKTAAAVAFTTPAVTVPAGIQSIQGTVTALTIANSITLSGSFSFTKQVDAMNPNVTKLLVGASGINVFLGTADQSVGLRVENAMLGLVIFKNTMTGASSYALEVSASASVVGFSSILTLTGTAGVRINTTGVAVTETVKLIHTDGSEENIPVMFSASEGNVTGFSGSMTLTIPSITATLSGKFYFAKSVDAATNTTKILIAAAEINGSANGGAFNLAGGQLGLVLFRNTQTNTNRGYALVASATVGVGAGGEVNLSGNASARVNTTNGAVNETVSVGGTSIPLVFTGNEQTFTASDVTLAIGNFATLSGTASTSNVAFTDQLTGETFTQLVTFTNVTITFFVDSRELVSVGGSATFRSGGTGGMKLLTFGLTTFSFLGDTSTGSSGPNNFAPAAGGTMTRTLGPVTLGSPTIGLSQFQFKPDGTLSARVSIGATSASLTTSVASASLVNIAGNFDLGVKINLADPFGAPESFTVGGFDVTIGTVTITIGSYLTLTGSGVKIDPTASADEDLISFVGVGMTPGLTASLHIGSITLSGSADNFAILGNGSFVAKNNFSVSFGFGPGQDASSTFKWPSWLPLQNLSIGLLWPGNNFNTNPTNFQILLSAGVQSIQGLSGVSFSGSVTGVRIDVQKLLNNEFPIVGIQGVTVEVEGQMFGGDIKLGLTAGIISFDAMNKVIPENDFVTEAVDSVFYAGLEGMLTLKGLGEISMRLGLSDFGPLTFYIEAGFPIILDPQTGLAITNLRGGVDFGAALPDPTKDAMGNDLTAKQAAFNLRSPQFAPPGSQTIAQWTAQLKQQIVNLKKSIGPGNTLTFADLTKQMLIRAGATLYDTYASTNAFRADVDITIDTSGKILINGTATFGNSLSVKAYFYADLEMVQAGMAKFLFLVDVPGSTPGNLFPPIYTVYGKIDILVANDSLTITVDGGALLNAVGMAEIEVVATLTLTFSSTTFRAQFTGDLYVNKPDLGQLASAQGDLTINRTPTNEIEVWGYVNATVNLASLRAQGIDAQGDALLQINTTNRSFPITLKKLNSMGVLVSQSATLEPRMFSIQVGGTATFSISGSEVFRLTGGFELRIDSSKLLIFASATATVGPAGAPLMSFGVLGLVQIMYDDTGLTGFAASLKLTRSGALPAVPNTSFSVTLLLEINLTGQAITYNIPPLLQPYVGTTPVTIPAGPRQFDGVTFGPAAPYIVIQGTGTLSLLGHLNLVGAFRIEVSNGVTLQIDALLSIDPLGQLNVSGSITVNSSGLIGALVVTLNAQAGEFTFSGKLQVEINTSTSAQMVPRFTVSRSGQVTGQQMISIPAQTFRLFIGGHLNVYNVVTVDGSFEVTVSSTYVSVAIGGRIIVFGVELGVSGYGALYGGPNPGLVLALDLSISASLQTDVFSLSGTFRLRLNTRNVPVNFTPPAFSAAATENIAANFAQIAVTNVDLNILGFHFSGSLYITLQGSYFRIEVPSSNPLSFDFFGIVTFQASGFIDSNGNFDLRASFSISFGDCDIACVHGTLGVRVFSYYDAFGIHHAGFSGHLDGSADLVGISIISVNADLYVDNNEVKLYVEGCIWIICASHTFTFGTLQSPPPPPTIGSLLPGGELRLNMGTDAGNRTVALGVTDEAYVIEHLDYLPPLPGNGVAGGETIAVTAFGYREVFRGVTNIFASNVGGGSDSVEFGAGVTTPLSLQGGTGSFVVVLGGTSTANIRGGSSTNLQVTAGPGSNIVNGQSAAFMYVILNPAGTHTLTASSGQNRFSIPTLNSGANTTINASAGSDNRIYLGFDMPVYSASWVPATNSNGNLGNIQASVGITGNANTIAYLDDTAATLGRTGTISTSSLTGFGLGGSGITYSGLNTFNIILADWGNTINISGVSATTTNLNLGGGVNTVTVGSTNTLNNILGNLNLTGSGNDAMIVIDTASPTGKTGTLTSSTLSGLGMAGTVTYTGMKTLGITLNDQGNTLTIVSTFSGTTTTVNTGADSDTVNIRSISNITTINLGLGADTVNIGSLAPLTGGVLNQISFPLIINGSGNDTVNLDDSGSSSNKTGILTSTTIAGLGMGSGIPMGGATPVVITYSGLSALNITLGSGNDSFTIQSTITGITIINAGSGNDTFFIKTIAGPTTINGGIGNETFNVGSTAPAIDSVMNGIGALLTLNGEAGTDIINADDRADTTDSVGTLTTTRLSGLGMAVGVEYSGIETFNIDLGSGHDVFNVQGTSAVTNLNAHDGDDQFYISSLATVSQTTKFTTDFLTGTLDNLAAALNINAGLGRHLLMISDASAAVANGSAVTHAVITNSLVRGLSLGDITYQTDAAGNFADGITIWSGDGADYIDVTGTHERAGVRTITTLNTGLGNDNLVVTLLAGTDGFFVLNTQGPDQDGLLAPPTDDDVVDASGSTLSLFIFGGQGNDQITGGSGDDVIFGDRGRVYFRDDSGNLVSILGNGGPGDLTDGIVRAARSIFAITSPLGGNDTLVLAGGQDIAIGGEGDDSLDGGVSTDVLIGDHGMITYDAQGVVTRIELLDVTVGGNDTINGGNGGDFILAGTGADTANGNAGDDIIIGDIGSIDFAAAPMPFTPGAAFRPVTLVRSLSPTVGGTDTLTGGDDDDVIIGGSDADSIDGNNGTDILIGDHGMVTYGAQGVVARIELLDITIGGNDTINGGNGGDFILAGNGSDIANGDAGNDIVFGDIGSIDFATTTASFAPAATFQPVSLTQSLSPTVGAGDTLTGGDDNDLIFGGTGDDTIDGGAGSDIIFGDHGRVNYSLPANNNFISIFTGVADGAGNDTINGGAGDDFILGQQGNDLIFGDGGDDDIWGGHNVNGGVDGSDRLDGGLGNDVLLGDNGTILRRGDAISVRVRVIVGPVLYTLTGDAPVGTATFATPTGVAARDVLLLNGTTAQGDDLVAGGGGDDLIFGQLGNDTLRGDGRIDPMFIGLASLLRSIDNTTDGDDYIEGNSGTDTIYGDLGQDDLIGGSSDLFGLTTPAQRADGTDTIFGGDGTDILRNTPGDQTANGHARDADVILGDNGRIYRLVGTNGVSTGAYLAFNYDNSPGATLHIIPRAISLLDYTVGTRAKKDIGAADIIHGEAGNDLIHGMAGNDVIYGEGQDDSIIGGTGDDWISAGSGDDGAIGDDGRILTSRNGIAEPLFGIAATQQTTLTSSLGVQVQLKVTGQLSRTMYLIAASKGGKDFLYGGLGNDFLHGGAGNDGISGAEALQDIYALPSESSNRLFKPGVLKYDRHNPLARINGHPLNFEATDSLGAFIDDGKDVLFGEDGTDWLVGGTNSDQLFGGNGNDYLNVDDNLATSGGANTSLDAAPFDSQDIAFGGAGQDTMLANSLRDRLFDLTGEFNGRLTPTSIFGNPNMSAIAHAGAGSFLRSLMISNGLDGTLTGITVGGKSASGRGFWQIGPR